MAGFLRASVFLCVCLIKSRLKFVVADDDTQHFAQFLHFLEGQILRIVGVRILELFFQKAKKRNFNGKNYFFAVNLQLVCLLVTDGFQSVDEVPDDLHPEILGILVLSHQIHFFQLCR